MIAWASFACSVCFTDSASPLTKGAFAGVTVMLGFVAFVLGTIAWIAYSWARRAKQSSEGGAA